MSFPHLRVHSDFTLGTGASKPAELVRHAASLDMPAMALTDRNALSGAMSFSKLASGEGLQPIIGMELDITDTAGSPSLGSVILLATSERGYVNLCRLLRLAYGLVIRDGHESYPAHVCVRLQDLLDHSEGIILLTGSAEKGLLCAVGEKQGVQKAHEMARALLGSFGSRLYIEICRNDLPGSDGGETEAFLLDISRGACGEVLCADGVTRREIPLVATTEVWYSEKKRHTGFRLLEAVRNGHTLTIVDDHIKGDPQTRYHLRTYDEMAELFHDIPEALRNTFEVARRSAFIVRGRDPVLPPFRSETGLDEPDELRRCAREGLADRMKKMSLTDEGRETYSKRLEFELDVIVSMGFPGYFLIVSDFIRWAKARGIAVGPGRGSGAGSLVAWALLITNIDPIVYGLLFERFLNPDRVSMPDFDIDFCIERRHEVIEYVRRRYGDDRVSTIITFGGIMARTAVRDTGRVLLHDQVGHFSFRDINEAVRFLPTSPAEGKKSLADCEKDYEDLRRHLSDNSKSRALFDYGQTIEKLYRQSGTHAAGIIIGDRPLDELFPVIRDSETLMPTAGFSQSDVEAAGAVKFDFLGLRNLTIIRRTIDYVRQYEGKLIDIDDIPLDDPECYSAMAKGLTTGVFQLASRMMRDVLIKVQPTCLDDIVAVNALGRPGPMKYIPNYAARKAGHEPVVYPGPEKLTRPILEETYGFMVYQEQVMRVAQVCAGYSLGGADLLRRAMGKKKAEEMARQRKVFIHGDETTAGAVRLGMTEAAAGKLFADIEAFASYGFNKSHAVAYALIAYQTVWLKVHHPACFYAALMTYTDRPEVLNLIKNEMRHFGLSLLPPNISRSDIAFVPEHTDDGLMVRFGLSAIKNISADRGAFIAERKKHGPFRDLVDFQKRTKGLLNSAAIERMVEAGSFDEYAKTRQEASNTLKWLSKTRDRRDTSGMDDMFGDAAPFVIPEHDADGNPVAGAPEWADRMSREFSAVGFYFGQHPVSLFRPVYAKSGIKRRSSYVRYMKKVGTAELRGRRLSVLVNGIFHGVTQQGKGKPYIKVEVSEPDDSYVVMFFTPRSWGHGRVDSLEWVAKTLETARQNNEPVVIQADLTFDANSGHGANVTGQCVERASLFLNETHADHDIVVDLKTGLEAYCAKLEAQLRKWRSESDRASQIRILSPSHEVVHVMPGRYEINRGILSALRYSGDVLSIHSPDRDDDTDDLDAEDAGVVMAETADAAEAG